MKKLMGLVVAVFLIAAACSDSDDGGGISIASGDGGGGGDWCDFARQVEQASDDLDFETATPEELESQLNRFNDLLDEAKSRAPGEIQDAVNTTADAFGTFADAFADANYNILDADLAVLRRSTPRSSTRPIGSSTPTTKSSAASRATPLPPMLRPTMAVTTLRPTTATPTCPPRGPFETSWSPPSWRSASLSRRPSAWPTTSASRSSPTPRTPNSSSPSSNSAASP